MNESYQIALGALAVVGTIVSAVVSGYILLLVKSSRSRNERDISQLGLQIVAEGEERRSAIAIEVRERQQAINAEGDVRRVKDEGLGRDISKIRERMAYDRGRTGKAFKGENGDD